MMLAADNPVSLFDGKGGYTDFVQSEVVGKLLSVIEESGLSYQDAGTLPSLLALAIEAAKDTALKRSRFKTVKE